MINLTKEQIEKLRDAFSGIANVMASSIANRVGNEVVAKYHRACRG